jgi:hypothetical protein
MPPRKQYDAQLGDDVRVRYIEVVFQGGDGDESTNLRLSAHFRDKIEGCGGLRTYVLLHVLLAGVKGSLAHLQAHLCGGVVHKAPERRVHVVSALTLLRHATALLSISISTMGL